MSVLFGTGNHAIVFESLGFADSSFNRDPSIFTFSKLHLIWSAMTIDIHPREKCFKSYWIRRNNILYKLHILEASLDCERISASSKTSLIVQNEQYNYFERSEKALFSNIQGLIFTKLIADKVFQYPYMLYLDNYNHYISRYGMPPYTRMRGSKLSPDFIAFDANNKYGVFESKGRSRAYSCGAEEKAKEQVQTIKAIGGNRNIDRIATQTYFSSFGEGTDILHFRCIDPESDFGYELPTSEQRFFDYYYPVYSVINDNEINQRSHHFDEYNNVKYITTTLDNKFTIGIPSDIYKQMDIITSTSLDSEYIKLNQIMTANMQKYHELNKLADDDDESYQKYDGYYIGNDGILVSLK